MFASIKPEVLGIIVPKEVMGTLTISKNHDTFVLTPLAMMENMAVAAVDKRDSIIPHFNWRLPQNSHGFHCSHNLTGEKAFMDMRKVVEKVAMRFKRLRF
jgi:hypothetical protein